jgi:hypothetical protein|tara:strand:- start:1183 stop:1323 length:141 start_codon:yes stop_codon:yes gene_type:complete
MKLQWVINANFCDMKEHPDGMHVGKNDDLLPLLQGLNAYFPRRDEN